MTEVAQASVPVFPTFQGFRTAVVSEADSASDAASRSFGSRFAGGIGRVAKGVGVAVGATLVAGVGIAAAGVGATFSEGLSRALNLQDARAQLTGLGHDADSVSSIMDNALASVRGTAFGLDSAATVAATAVAAGIRPGEDLTRTLTLTADAATIARTSMDEMGGVINKVASSGKLSTEVLRQFEARGVPLLQYVADEYGITAEAASEMVSKGEVDFATFQNALENNVGGAALTSGETARGAFANIRAAVGRLGAMFLTGGVEGAPKLFQAIAGAVDRAALALEPYAEALNARIVPAMASLAAWIDTIDFGLVVAGMRGLYDLIVNGQFSGALRDAFSWEEDSGFVSFVLNARDAISGLYELIVNGNFSTALRLAFGVEEDSGFVTFVLGAREAVGELISSLTSGDLSGAASSIGTSLGTLAPAFQSFGAELPKIGSALAEVSAAGIEVLTGALGFLADNVDVIVDNMPLIVAGFVAWRLASTAVAAASLALRTTELLMVPVTTANNLMRANSVRIERQLQAARASGVAATASSTAAETANTAAKSGGLLTTIRSTAATIAQRVAVTAAAVAQRAAAAAQWLLNAAMTANPIMLIVTAIAALVAGLVYFFTQTELGQEIWANFTQFLGEAWENVSTWFMQVGENISTWWNGLWQGIVDFFTGIWDGLIGFVAGYGQMLIDGYTFLGTAISNWWNGLWQGVVDFFVGIWEAIVSFATTYVEAMRMGITAVVTAIVTWWQTTWSNVRNTILQVWSGIVTTVSGAIATVRETIARVVSTIVTAWRQGWAGIISFITDAWTNITTSVSSGVDKVMGFVTGLPDRAMKALGNLGNLLKDSGKALIQGFIDGISGMLGAVGDAVGGVMDFVGGFFPNSPAKRGPFSGSGWTRVRSGGRALAAQFTGGFGDGPALDFRTFAADVRSLPQRPAIAAAGFGGSDFTLPTDRSPLQQHFYTTGESASEIAEFAHQTAAFAFRR